MMYGTCICLIYSTARQQLPYRMSTVQQCAGSANTYCWCCSVAGLVDQVDAMWDEVEAEMEQLDTV
jgi:hypothetical protein